MTSLCWKEKPNAVWDMEKFQGLSGSRSGTVRPAVEGGVDTSVKVFVSLVKNDVTHEQTLLNDADSLLNMTQRICVSAGPLLTSSFARDMKTKT